MSQPRPQVSAYTLPTAVQLVPNGGYAQETALQKSNTSAPYVVNQGTDAAAVVSSIAFQSAPSSAIASVPYPSPAPVGYTAPLPPVLGFKYQQWACPTNPVSIVSGAAPTSIWPLFTNLPANMSGLFALECYCNTNNSYTFTTIGFLNTSGVGAVANAFGFGGSSYFPVQTGVAVSSVSGAAVYGAGPPAIGLYQYTVAGTAATFNLTLRSLMNT